MNLDKQKAMQELGLPEEAYDELLKMFLNSAAQALDRLDGFIQANDYGEISRTAHFIKGSAGNLRLQSIHDLAKGVESDAKMNPSTMLVIQGNIQQLKKELEELTQLVLRKEQ